MTCQPWSPRFDLHYQQPLWSKLQAFCTSPIRWLTPPLQMLLVWTQDAYELPKDEAAQIREPWRRAGGWVNHEVLVGKITTRVFLEAEPSWNDEQNHQWGINWWIWYESTARYSPFLLILTPQIINTSAAMQWRNQVIWCCSRSK